MFEWATKSLADELMSQQKFIRFQRVIEIQLSKKSYRYCKKYGGQRKLNSFGTDIFCYLFGPQPLCVVPMQYAYFLLYFSIKIYHNLENIKNSSGAYIRCITSDCNVIFEFDIKNTYITATSAFRCLKPSLPRRRQMAAFHPGFGFEYARVSARFIGFNMYMCRFLILIQKYGIAYNVLRN